LSFGFSGLGAAYGGVVNCDRAKMYYSQPRLQWCWAQLKRDWLSRRNLDPRRIERLMKPIRQEIDNLPSS
jgi:hypothetical protein